MVDSTPLIPGSSDSDTKQGQRILGCCDSRRAVIVINSIALAISSLGLLLILATSTPLLTWYIIAILINIFLYIIVLYSAIQFRYAAVIVGIFLAVVDIFVHIGIMILNYEGYTFSTFSIVVIGLIYAFIVLMIYAEWVYVFEVRAGIMKRENHSRESYSCCCDV